MKETKGIITLEEMELCKHCIAVARQCGASAMRVSLSKCIQNSISILDGEVDNISYSIDRSIFVHVFASGRYGTFSTNRLDRAQLEDFVKKAVETTVVLAADECRSLPSPERKAKSCTSGDELGLVDAQYFDVEQERKVQLALEFAKCRLEASDSYSIDSIESEYSDSYDDNYMVDSDGFEGRHTESNFGFCSEVTIQDTEGNRYSGYQWMSTAFFSDFDASHITTRAVMDAAAQIGPRDIKSGKYTVVVHTKTASRLVGPIIHALDGNSIQQKFSFLADSLGKRIFPENLTIYDKATEPGRMGSRLFDTEGVATADGPIIENGVVKKFFVNTYCSAKTGMEPTVEGPSRPLVEPFICNSDKKEITLNDILEHCGSGILVTGFNGGNCNQATGNFSFGIEGFVFENGRIVHPVQEALMTGNIIELWNSIMAAGSDARRCTRWQIPSLAFGNADISA